MFRSPGSVGTCPPGSGSIIPACKGFSPQTAATHQTKSKFEEFYCSLTVGSNPVKVTATFNGATNGYPDNFEMSFALFKLDSPGSDGNGPVIIQGGIDQSSIPLQFEQQWPEVIPANSSFDYKVIIQIITTTDPPSSLQTPQGTVLIGFNDETC